MALKNPRPLEKNIQKSIIQYLSTRQDIVFVMRVNSGKIRRGEKSMYDAVNITIGAGLKRITAQFISAFKATSVVDVLALRNDGKLIAIEVKRDAKSPIEPHQQAFIDMCHQANAIAFIAWDVEQVKAMLD